MKIRRQKEKENKSKTTVHVSRQHSFLTLELHYKATSFSYRFIFESLRTILILYVGGL